MTKYPSILTPILAIGLSTSAQAAFVASGGALIEDFNDGVVDTVTWSKATLGDPMTVSESGGELKIVQTLGFNGAYSTVANGINESTGLGDGSGMVEPQTAGNNNHRVRAIMRRRDPGDDRVAMGLSITTNVFGRTCGEAGDYACLVWQYVGQGAPASTFSPGDLLDLPVYPQTRESLPYSEIAIVLRNHNGPGMTPPLGQVNPIIGYYQTEVPGHPGNFDYFDLPGVVRQAPMWDYTGETQYAFEINWKTTTTADFSITEVRSEDLNNDLVVDILDFGIFAGDFGASGTDSDLDDSGGPVDIQDFGLFAGEFGKPSPSVLSRSLDWSTGSDDLNPTEVGNDPSACGEGTCWPESMGVQIYAHNVGTLWVDQISIFGDSFAAPHHSPEPTSIVLLGGSIGILLMRRKRKR